MYKLYDDEDNELTGRYRDDISYFEKDEKYAINEESGEQLDNPDYNQEDSDEFKKEIYVTNLLSSGNTRLIAEYNANRCNPDNEDYDYEYARQNGDAQYAPIEDQLDQLYHDIDQGRISVKAKTSEFYLNRKQVKESYPKKGELKS